jgi:integrase
MNGQDPNNAAKVTDANGIVVDETISLPPSRRETERMARKRFQDPKPKRSGDWWYILVWEDGFTDGTHTRTRKRVKLAPATMPVREVRKIAAEYVRPINQGLMPIGSGTGFSHFVKSVYLTTDFPLLAKSTQDRYRSVIDKYLMPQFGRMCLREMTPLTLQQYVTGLRTLPLAHESMDKIRDVLASILTSAKRYGLLVSNPAEGLRLPPSKKGRRFKPFVTPEQFATLVELIPEPYASMAFVGVYTGLRVSELIGLRWKNVHERSITIDERCCRGDWGAPKSDASNATIPVNRMVIERIFRLKDLVVEVRAGSAVRRYRAVKSTSPEDLVFQSVKTGAAMRDNNILVRFIKPAGRKLGMPWVNWRCLRTSHATWLKMAGADVKDAQAQLRHSRASTTLDIYQQFVVESQCRVVERLGTLGQTELVQ